LLPSAIDDASFGGSTAGVLSIGAAEEGDAAVDALFDALTVGADDAGSFTGRAELVVVVDLSQANKSGRRSQGLRIAASIRADQGWRSTVMFVTIDAPSAGCEYEIARS
jgi:hypothetical protein